MILSLFRKDPTLEAASALYASAVEQARLPVFYEKFAVPDTPEGRFELLSMHIYLVLRRLKGAGAAADRLSQKVLDAFFANLDSSLREMGVGDLSVGKKIRALAEAFYGRARAYEAGLEDGAAPSILAAAVSRNVYEEAEAEMAPALAGYLRDAAAVVGAQSLARLLSGVVRFPDAAAPALAE
ncbi:MAG: ubiquinol-cytochrome C chaperone family protein [Amphiplicatus sp.]